MKRIRHALIFSTAIAFLVFPVHAKEKFVKYADAKAQLQSMSSVQEGSVSVDEVKAMMDARKSFYLLDARAQSDFERERIVGAVLSHGEAYYQELELFKQGIIKQSPVPLEALKQNLKLIPQNHPVITYCSRNCSLSKNLAKQLKSLGFTNVRWLAGGIDSWREKGYPLVRR